MYSVQPMCDRLCSGAVPGSGLIRKAALPALALLSACAVPVEPNVTVRHIESTESAGNGARWHLFLFDPSAPRDLDTRIALARDSVRGNPTCRWVGASKDEIATQTIAQGARYSDTVLAAPLICEG
ncbi:hypothetical protein [Palleronia sp. LCG004]|uniref:hypothetical protein n=1 Tax=Palleronia sp. LCG004 TaxID=3079304 RepID=UPI00294345A5|nr:hypothetical protein [Palleronia sp. LCG004]WOI56892.1 hypothetical protein RVY76_03605 [Palleronia sp. LCG004]